MIIMKQLLFSIWMMSMTVIMTAQTNTYSKVTESDPEATAVLEQLRQKYESYESIEATFSIVIEIPEEDRIEQVGKMSQAGDQYRVDLEDQSIISNGEVLWAHFKNNNEVQINDAADLDSEGEIMSPNDILKIYESGEYVYILVDEYSREGTVIQQIEFKPLDKESDYHKLRLTIDKKASEIKNIKAFSKDGSRYTLKMTKFTSNTSFPEGHFGFDASQYPDIYVEDLRMD